MPRRARHYLAGLPYHVVQRGNNKEACFFAVPDYEYYLFVLAQKLKRYEVALHAYVLMTNHVHLLMTPVSNNGISDLMRSVGSRYACHINRNYGRTGTLWEGRHKSSAVDSEAYLFTCYRYIELNPVRAGMVAYPQEYRWSSHLANAFGSRTGFVTPHDQYLALAADPESRCRRYRELFRHELGENDVYAIRKSAHYCQPLGRDRFRRQIEAKTGQKAGYMARGRPWQS